MEWLLIGERSHTMKSIKGMMLLAAALLSGCGAAGLVDSGMEGADSVNAAESALSKDVAADLAFIREEEKMARDVYLTLAEKWGLPMFSGISRSETQHMSAMLTLLNRYSLKDPVGSAPRGVFADSEIQGLYSALVAQGRTSLVEALKVGAFIEDFDIVDIRTRLAMNPPADIAAVYQNLMMGSRNHLRAFSAQLANRGVTYVPKYLTPQEYQQIISTPQE
jgi:hypothetical protein